MVYTRTSGPAEVGGVPVVRVGRRHKFGGWLGCLHRLNFFRRADLVHVHNPHALLSLALPARAFLWRKPFVITLHGYASLPPPRVDALLQRLSSLLCGAVFCVGEFVAKWYGIRGCKVIWGATEVGEEPAPFPVEPVVAYVGRLSPDRPARVAVLAVAFSCRLWVGARLIVAGDGPLRGKLESLASRLGVEAEFLGWVREPREVVRRSSVVVASGYLSALEAMAEGRPALAVARDRWEEDYWEGFPGPVVRARSAREAGEAIGRLLSDRRRLLNLSRQSREFARRMTWEELAKAHLEVYRRLLRGVEKVCA